jgi:4-hydroxybenzoyl-CoA thioesterase/acyl-CoA thioester hydrolase
MGKVFTTQRRVEFRDTDAGGIVHFSAYLCYMEQAEHEFLRSVGLSVVQPHPSGGYISWPRVKVECSYAAPARFEELLSITLRITRLGSKSVTYESEFRSGQDSLVAKGSMVVVCCHIKDHGKSIVSIDIPDSPRAILAQYLNCDSNY